MAAIEAAVRGVCRITSMKLGVRSGTDERIQKSSAGTHDRRLYLCNCKLDVLDPYYLLLTIYR